MKLPGYPARWLIGSVALFLATPFLAFPEIMSDQGPRDIPTWRNLAGLALLGISGLGAVASLLQLLRQRRRRVKLAQ